MDLSMSAERRETFLAGLHVGIIGVNDVRGGPGGPDGPGGPGAGAPDGRAPLLVPVWYAYRPGGTVDVQTARDSVKARLIQAAGRFSLCVQDETAPYRYVSVEGPLVAVEDPVAPEARDALAHRYLPPAEAEAYLQGTRGQLTDDVLLRMRPQRWRTADFAAFAAEFGGQGGQGQGGKGDEGGVSGERGREAQPLLQGEA